MTVLRNDGGNRNNFLVIDLVGRKSNRSAFGARVKVVAGDLMQIDERRSGGSYLSQNDARLHFGLEKRQKVDRVEVRWPDGAIETLTDVAANRFITITEGERSRVRLLPSRVEHEDRASARTVSRTGSAPLAVPVTCWSAPSGRLRI